MRRCLALTVLLITGGIGAQERTQVSDAALVAFAAQPSGSAIEFAVETATAIPEGALLELPVTILLPVEQLHFVESDGQLVATLSVHAVVHAGASPTVQHLRVGHRITAPLGTSPVGEVRMQGGVAVPRGAERVTIIVAEAASQRMGSRTIRIANGDAVVDSVANSAPADHAWADALKRASAEAKPLLVFFRSYPCARCREFEEQTATHPVIVRRLPSVIFTILPATAGRAAERWDSSESGIALFDHAGRLYARWRFVPGTTAFAILLDSATGVAPHLNAAAAHAAAAEVHESELETARALVRLERFDAAREALARAQQSDRPATRQSAQLLDAMLDASDGKRTSAMERLRAVAAAAATPQVAATAWIALGDLHRSTGSNGEAMRAFSAAADIAPAGSAERTAAMRAVEGLRERQSRAIRILPAERQVVTGKETVRVQVHSPAVARVTFSLDGKSVAKREQPPFSATIDFGPRPDRHELTARAFDRNGRELGGDQRIVNDAGESFWVRIVEPRDGSAAGRTPVTLSLRIPAAVPLRRATLYWNDAERTTLREPPWETSVNVPAERVGVLRVVAELADGRTSEDAVLLNGRGFSDQATAQLVGLPITVVGPHGPRTSIDPADLTIREKTLKRTIESIATAADTPLTVGLLIDASDSMQKTLPDVQEAAIRFLETILGERDRAFLVIFNTRARLVQPAIGDVALLRRQILSIRAEGLTALRDAMVLGLMQFEGVKGRRAMIAFTDGVDQSSRHSVDDVEALARRMNVPVHVIAPVVGVAASRAGAPREARPNAEHRELMRIAEAAGGVGHALTDLAKLPSMLQQIDAVLRAQLLAFIRVEPARSESEWRAVSVVVKGDGLTVHAPEGYSATW